MMRARAICVCRDQRVCAAVGNALAEAGIDVDHQAAIPAEPGEVALFVVDRETRRVAADRLREAQAPVVVVGDDLNDDGLITLMLEGPVRHLVRDPEDRDLEITSEKLVTGDMFGLEKYLDTDAPVGERVITSDIEKRIAMAEVTAWAEAIGVRRPIVHRLASVIDELLMNALHDAPRESKPVLELTTEQRRAILRWAADAHTIAISVSDEYGAIRQRDVIDHVRRARVDRGRPNEARTDDPGAGLGLYLVLANVASLIVNVERGRRTEVVCLFDRPRRDRPAVASGVRSLHVFRQR
jgi:anti-sigma regulatory factor (Ser/Thr protein kinase)